MVNEKTYINFYIGKFHIELKDNYEYTDNKTGKAHFRKLFRISSYNTNDGSISDWISIYSGLSYPCFVYETCGYSDNRHTMHFSLGYGKVYIVFPWKNKNVYEEDINNPEKKYGFYLYGDGGFFDSFWYYVNKNGHSDVKSIDMPWSYKFYRHSILLKDGSWWTSLDKDVRKARKSGIDTYSDKRYYLDSDDESIFKAKLPFSYTTKHGTEQNTTATVRMEEREWRQRWLYWTKLFNHVSTVLEIEFNDEMGNKRGSWKGGTLGCSCKVTKNQKEKLDLITPLKRFEKEANSTKYFDK